MKRGNLEEVGPVKRAFLWILSGAFGTLMLLPATAFSEGQELYRARNKRDPFVPLVALTTKASVGGLLSVESMDDIQVEGVVVDADPARSIVIANGSVLKTGEEVGNVKVMAIRADGAEFSVNGMEGFKPLYQDEKQRLKQ